MNKPRCKALFATLMLTVSAAAWSQTPLYKNSTRSFEERAADLVSRMTLEEKVSQMQNVAPAIPRLDIPAYDWWNEGLHGVARAGQATVFPQAIGLAATFDTTLMHQVATTISDEARAKYKEFQRRDMHGRYEGLTYWSPNINIFRDPRWGRGQETYGEDPFLTSRMGVAFVRGMQGDDPKYRKLDATAKHYAVHSGPESERHRFDVHPSERDLYETYLPAFQALVQEAKVDAVMGAYNRVDGASASASPRLLQDILRKQWGFDGYTVSDCDAVEDIYQQHKIVQTAEQAAALAVKNGMDLNCGQTYAALTQAVHDGLIAESDIDHALKQLMVARFRLGMFDPPALVPWSRLPYSVNQSAQHDELARRAADESIVLLKNNGMLPLSPDVRHIAVIGPTADDIAPLLGNYHGTPKAPVTILQGIREAAPHAEVVYARGTQLVEGIQGSDTASLKNARQKALDAVQKADVVIFVGGLTADLEGEEMKVNYPGFAGGDRTDLRLPATQEKLLEAVQATGKPVVLVLTSGSALAIDWAKQQVPAILLAWYPGQRGGTAVADALFGRIDPAGRLPITLYKADEKLPPFDDYRMEGRTYRYFKGEPLYPFGYGLSYTRFTYADLQLDRTHATSRDHIKITLKVKNTGERAGDDVVQLYLKPLHAAHARVNEELRGFQRVHLQAGEEQTVAFDISPATDLKYYDDEHHAYAVDPGSYRAQIGASSTDIRLAKDFAVEP